MSNRERSSVKFAAGLLALCTVPLFLVTLMLSLITMCLPIVVVMNEMIDFWVLTVYGVVFGLFSLGYFLSSLMIVMYRMMMENPLWHRHQVEPKVLFYSILKGYLSLSWLMLILGVLSAYIISFLIKFDFIEGHHYFLVSLLIVGTLFFISRKFLIDPRLRLAVLAQEEHKKAEDSFISSAGI